MRKRDYKEKPATNHSSDPFFKPRVQKKLAVGKPGDKFEKEADNVADKVVNKADSGNLQRAAMPGEEEKVQQKPLSETISSVQKKELQEEEQSIQKAAEVKEDEQPVQKQEEPEEKGAVQQKEEEEQPVQKAVEVKEDEQPVQKQEEPEEKGAVQQKEEEEQPVQKAAEVKEDEQPVQKQEEPEEKGAVQQKEKEEQPVQKAAEVKEDEQPVQKQEEPEEKGAVQQKEEEEQNKPAQAKKDATQSTNQTEKQLTHQRGQGTAMTPEVQREMESGFGTDLSNVKIHTDAKAVQMSQQMGAQAFTHGNDIYFNEGKYNPGSREGKHLLAHEITHTIQQNGGGGSVQKKHTPDTGWRYTPPVSVRRSIVEIQGIVNATPDGVYGIDTKNAVEDYQRMLTSRGLYSGPIDGKWGPLTDVGHNSMALDPRYRMGYNCAGFAFKKFTWIDLVPTRSAIAAMTPLANSTVATTPYHYKFWYWEVDLATHDTLTGATSPAHRDFHIVGGQTDGRGSGPTQVMSKNGGRPVEGPAPPLSFAFRNGPAPQLDGTPSPRFNWVVTNVILKIASKRDLP